jgi:uncharacterized protein YyaL (SSP411 family)
MAAYGVTPGGNFEGKNILEFVGDLDQRPALAEARRKLFEVREKRVHPGRDEKVLTAWNGLMLAAFAEAARALNQDDCREVAERNADLLLRELRQDNATPSGNAMAVTALLKLAGLTKDPRYVDIGHGALAQLQPMMAQCPLGFGQWLQAPAYALSKPREIAIVGDPKAAATQALLGVLRNGRQPFQVVALGAPDAQPPAVPLLQDRGLVEGHAAAYVCRDFACQAPVTSQQALEGLILD